MSILGSYAHVYTRIKYFFEHTYTVHMLQHSNHRSEWWCLLGNLKAIPFTKKLLDPKTCIILRSEQHVGLVVVIILSQICIVYLHVDATAQSGAAFGQGTGPISLNNVGCTGDETRLVDCSFSNNTVGCTHSNDASATCLTQCKLYVCSNLHIAIQQFLSQGKNAQWLDLSS